VQFGETASTVVDINKKLTNFPLLQENNYTNNTGITYDYTLLKPQKN
jgi:hypothetical protein